MTDFNESHINKRHFEHFSDVVCGQLVLVDVGTNGGSHPRVYMRGPHQVYLRLAAGRPDLAFKPMGGPPMLQPSDFPHVDPIEGWHPTAFKPPKNNGDIYWIDLDLWKTIRFTLFG